MTGNVCVFGSKRGQETVGVRSDLPVFCARPPGAATQQRRCNSNQFASPQELTVSSESLGKSESTVDQLIN